jgi:hypothetical protein
LDIIAFPGVKKIERVFPRSFNNPLKTKGLSLNSVYFQRTILSSFFPFLYLGFSRPIPVFYEGVLELGKEDKKAAARAEAALTIIYR